jgi:predicted RND superfamily exporter protein
VHHLTRLSLTYPKTTIAILLVVTAILGAGLPNVRSEYGYRVLVGDDYPSIQALDALIEQFGGGLPVQIAWECGPGRPCANVFDEASLKMADAVTRELAGAEGVRDVVGPANAPLLVPQADGFAVRRFVERGRVADDASYLARRALDDRLWRGKLVSSDGNVGAIIVQPADTRSATDILVVDAVHSALIPFERQGFHFHMAGDAAETYLGGRELAESSTRLVPLTVLVIGFVLYVLSRSARQTLVVLATMGVTLLWTFGLLGWIGWPRDGILEVLAPLLLIVGVCDSMHLLAGLADAREREEATGDDPESPSARRRRLLEVSRDVGGACTFTTLTDAGAFLSFLTSSLDTFVRFGVISAFGVMAALCLSFSLFPLLMCAVPHGRAAPHSTGNRWSSALDQIASLSRRRARPILVVAGISVVVFSYCWIALLRVDTNWLESWGNRSKLTRSVRFIEEKLGSSRSIEVRLTIPESTSLDAPESIGVVRGLSDALGRINGVSGTSSVLDLVATVNRLLHDNDPVYERAPAEAGATAEILELLSLDDESVVSPWLNIDHSQLRLSATTRALSYQEGVGFLAQFERARSSIVPPNWGVAVTGAIPMTVAWVTDVQATQLRGFPTAVLTVYLLVAGFLRSWRLGLAALLPTLIPIVVTLGAMGLLGLSLDVGRAMIGSVVIGIGVDDAIHLLSQYRKHRENGSPAPAAMSAAMQHSGRAILVNALSLSLGFLTLMASAWQSISSFGFFVALAILGALVSTLVVMPALIFTFTRSADA